MEPDPWKAGKRYGGRVWRPRSRPPGWRRCEGRRGATTSPPPLPCVQEWPVEGACGLGFCGWQGDHLESVAEVEEYFAQKCFEADQILGEPAACRWFLNWFDETPRGQMRRLLLAEVNHTLAQRRGERPAAAAEEAGDIAAA